MSQIIKELTPEQEQALITVRDKWKEIGLCTTRFTLERAKELMEPMLTKVLGRVNVPVILADNLIEAWETVELLATDIDMPLRAEGYNSKQEMIDDLISRGYDPDPSPERMDYVQPWLAGSMATSTWTYYDFFLNHTPIEVAADVREKFDIWKALSELGAVFPLQHACVVTQKPKAIHMNEHGLHRDGGMALEYEGWGYYALNGVTVPEYLAMTDSGKLDLDWYHKQTNADVRTEFVRKFGVERMLEMGKKVDSYENYDEEWWTKSQYELWDMACLFPNLEYQPFLKMLNQTTGVWHVEAVSPDCRTLADAVKERFGGNNFDIESIA